MLVWAVVDLQIKVRYLVFWAPITFTNRLFLQRSLQAFMAVNGSRNTVVFRGFNISRQAYTGDEEDDSIGGEQIPY